MSRIDEINAELADIAEEMSGKWEQFMADQPLSEAAPQGGGASQMLGWVEESIPLIEVLSRERSELGIERLRGLDFDAIADALGWSEGERVHARDSMASSGDYGDECTIQTDSGRQICCPAVPAPCSYVRICQAGFELAYWNADELRESPEEVLGAILGAANNFAKLPQDAIDLRTELILRQRREMQR